MAENGVDWVSMCKFLNLLVAGSHIVLKLVWTSI